ncbi:thioredoxin-related transmembrane protein 1-like [Ornithodoros turicata]|uniref:thioredoxin-related transmembrane protein 1-like n=1 Tax=Ornithodoros turicata TaxID=34597 RepID=UPI0031396FD4
MAISLLALMRILLLLSLASLSASRQGQLVELDEDSWHQLLEGEWMVEFFAPWCPACKALGPIWKDFSQWSNDLGVKIAHVDVTINPGLSGRFMVTALPTIYHVKDGVFRQYRGSRDKESFISFVEEKKWQGVEPVSAWKSPQSIQMSLVAQFFKLSMAVRGLHTTLVDNYGIPYWGSYILFALATIVLGALLGLLIVFIIDVVFPPKPPIFPTQAKGDDLSKGDARNSESGTKSDEEEDLVDENSEEKGESSKEEEVDDEKKDTEERGDSAEVRRRKVQAPEGTSAD